MRLYIHHPGSPEVSVVEDASPDARVATLVDVVEGDFVFFDDGDDPVDIQLTLAEVVRGFAEEDRHQHHVHHHPCRQIAVEVVYNGRTKEVPARAGTQVETVLLRAISEFEIDPVTGADLVLRLPGSADDLGGTTHVGTLVPRGRCTLTLNLLPGHREQG
jgi:hypothetical protein